MWVISQHLSSTETCQESAAFHSKKLERAQLDHKGVRQRRCRRGQRDSLDRLVTDEPLFTGRMSCLFSGAFGGAELLSFHFAQKPCRLSPSKSLILCGAEGKD
jgi:hypothetical protein